MNVLVTGGSGFIGSHVSKALLEENNEVFALSRSEGNERVASLQSYSSFHLVNGDVCCLPQMRNILESNNIDAVIHFANTPSHGSKDTSTNLKHF